MKKIPKMKIFPKNTQWVNSDAPGAVAKLGIPLTLSNHLKLRRSG